MSEQDQRPASAPSDEHLSDTETRQHDVDQEMGVTGEEYIERLESGDSGVGY